MTDFTIYHNPRCSKSRQTLQLLRDHQIEPAIVLYLESAPSVPEITHLLSLLKMTPRELMRKGEAQYKELKLDDESCGDAMLIEAMHSHPILIERPIVVAGDSAVIGRPPENVLELIK